MLDLKGTAPVPSARHSRDDSRSRIDACAGHLGDGGNADARQHASGSFGGEYCGRRCDDRPHDGHAGAKRDTPPSASTVTRPGTWACQEPGLYVLRFAVQGFMRRCRCMPCQVQRPCHRHPDTHNATPASSLPALPTCRSAKTARLGAVAACTASSSLIQLNVCCHAGSYAMWRAACAMALQLRHLAGRGHHHQGSE